jgi:hypothetical protein
VFGPQAEEQEGEDTEDATEDELWRPEAEGVEIRRFTPPPGSFVIDLTRDATPIFIDLTAEEEEAEPGGLVPFKTIH